MLTELRIRNFAIIEELGLEFSDGFTVLTGETGAGKSILVDAVDLLIGGRGSVELIRAGAEESEVSGVFSIPAKGPVAALLQEQDLQDPGDTALILRRILSRSGRHRAHINGRPAPLNALQALRGLLVDIHGQHDHQSLFKAAVQLELLDAYGGLTETREAYAKAFENARALQALVAERRERGAAARTREELLRYQVQEITGANPRVGEDRELEHERLLLSQGRRLAELVQAVYGPLYEEESSLLAGLQALAGPVKELAGIDTEWATDRERFEEALTQLGDLAQRLRNYRDRLEYDPARLDSIEERLDLLRKLIKKYGGSLEEVLRRGEQAAEDLRTLDTLEADIAALSAQAADAYEKAVQAAQALSKKRAKAAHELEKALASELVALQMKATRLRIVLEQQAEPAGLSLTATGMDRVEFLFSANPGEPLQPLARIASGGELSRVMLALKTVLARVDRVPVLVFDEVDAGIGGAVSEVVGKRLLQLARHGHQVFCITHLAPIAAQAQHHCAVTKAVRSGRTVTQVTPLDAAGRVEEVARMLGGATITPKVRATAAEMLRSAQR